MLCFVLRFISGGEDRNHEEQFLRKVRLVNNRGQQGRIGKRNSKLSLREQASLKFENDVNMLNNLYAII